MKDKKLNKSFRKKNKFDVITCKMRHMYTMQGGIHCSTLDTRRKSKLESYI